MPFTHFRNFLHPWFCHVLHMPLKNTAPTFCQTVADTDCWSRQGGTSVAKLSQHSTTIFPTKKCCSITRKCCNYSETYHFSQKKINVVIAAQIFKIYPSVQCFLIFQHFYHCSSQHVTHWMAPTCFTLTSSTHASRAVELLQKIY